MDELIGVAFVVYFAIWLVGFITQILFRRKLFREFPELCEQHGLVQGAANNSPAQSWRFIRFVMGAHYEAANSPALSRLGLILRAAMILMLVGLMGLVALFVTGDAR